MELPEGSKQTFTKNNEEEEDHLKTAEKLESEKLAKINFNSTRIVDLDALLCDTYDRDCPKPVHYQNRRDLIRIFNMMAKEIYGNSMVSPVVEEYGSFVMDIFNERSDLDLSINFSDSIEINRMKKIQVLRKFSKKLRSIQKSGHVTALEVILSAKVPIVKVTDIGTGVECDLSVENRDGIAKSHIIRAISAIDGRFQKLCLLMKSWAKAHNINSSKDATLNSLSIVSFVAFHFQTCDPPILPPFSTLLKEGADLESVTKAVKTYTNYGNKNKQSLAHLFVTLLVKLASVENLWQNGYCTSSYNGSWVLKNWHYSMSVEDFTDLSQNVARAVRAEGFKTIYKCIHNSIDYLSRFLNGEIQGIELMDHLFGKPMLFTLGVEGTSSNINENKNNPPTLHNPRPLKKRRIVKNQAGDFHQTEPRGADQVHVPPSSNVPNGVEGTSTSNTKNKNNPPTGKVHVPPSSNVLNGAESTSTSNINEKKNSPPTSRNPRSPKKRTVVKNQVRDFQQTEPYGTSQVHVHPSSNVPNRLASFPPPLPYQSRYQSSFATHSTDFMEHHGYVPGHVPPYFGLNPAGFQGSYNPTSQSNHVCQQIPGGYVQTFHQNAVASNPYHGSFLHSSLQGRDYASLHARDYAIYSRRSG